MIKKTLQLFIATICLFGITAQSAFAAGIVPSNAMALHENPPTFSVVNFDTGTGDAVDVSESGITGNAWGAQFGWMYLTTDTFGVTVNCNPDGTATLGGQAWSDVGPFDFAPSVTGPVTIDENGYFDGYAWNDNVGWLHFDKTTCDGGDGCVQTDFRCDVGPTHDDHPTGSVPACKIFASDDSVSIPGSAVELTWDMYNTNPDVITINGTPYGTHDSLTVYPMQTTTYTGYVTRNETTKACTKTIVVEKKTPETCPFFTEYHRLGDRGGQISHIQEFLNGYMNEHLAVDGIYGWRTANAVGRFQTRHFDDIIKPWSPPLPLKITKRWYKTTLATANIIIGCPQQEVYLEDPQITHSFKDTMQRLFNIFTGLFQ